MTQQYFFTSDTHFSHRNIINYCNRPFNSVSDMDDAIIENWNKTVSKKDIVFHLGDVIFSKTPEHIHKILSALNGEKHLIWGNHDKLLRTSGWQTHFRSASELRKINVPTYTDSGEIVTQQFVLCHYAMRVWDVSHYGAIQLYGHSHGTLPDVPELRQCDVGVDCWNFTPVSVPQILELMKQKPFTRE